MFTHLRKAFISRQQQSTMSVQVGSFWFKHFTTTGDICITPNRAQAKNFINDEHLAKILAQSLNGKIILVDLKTKIETEIPTAISTFKHQTIPEASKQDDANINFKPHFKPESKQPLEDAIRLD